MGSYDNRRPMPQLKCLHQTTGRITHSFQTWVLNVLKLNKISAVKSNWIFWFWGQNVSPVFI